MLSNSPFGLTALALESALLLRAFRRELPKTLPLFLFLFGLGPGFGPGAHPFLYLLAQNLRIRLLSSHYFSLVVGCCVVWEAYKVALARYPGAARMARNVFLFLFILAITRIFVKHGTARLIPGKTTLETERDLRIVQVTLLIGLVALFAITQFPWAGISREIIYGYGRFLSPH